MNHLTEEQMKIMQEAAAQFLAGMRASFAPDPTDPRFQIVTFRVPAGDAEAKTFEGEAAAKELFAWAHTLLGTAQSMLQAEQAHPIDPKVDAELKAALGQAPT